MLIVACPPCIRTLKEKSLLTRHKVKQLSDSIQKFYNDPCFEVSMENEGDLDEVLKVLEGMCHHRTDE